ncbi:MAG: hypothetical protein AB1608_02685 [Thermoproteota archaeon]
MLKIVGLAALGLLALLVLPVNSETNNDDLKLYGYATMVLHDAAGNEMFLQVLHNQLVNDGETMLLNQTFYDNSAGDQTTDNLQIGSICITNGMGSVNETDTAASFNSTNTLGGNFNCKFDQVDITTTQGKAVIAPAAFQADGVNIVNGQTIRGIGICTAAGAADFPDCNRASFSKLFAEVNTSDVTLNTGETVTITYTFDLTSPSS